MRSLIKPPRLRRGDKVATVSPSSGCAGDEDMRWRYEYGVSRLRDVFGLEVEAMPHSLKGSAFTYEHPEARAEDLMRAFADPSVKGIVTNVGGDDSIRLLPYINFGVIRDHPKVLIGFSDTTSVHLMCAKAGLSSFYGTSTLCEFAENVRMHDYTKNALEKALFRAERIGEVPAAPGFSAENPTYGDERATKTTPREFEKNAGYEILQGTGKARGRLLGGCIEILDLCKGTAVFPPLDDWKNALLFLDVGEGYTCPYCVQYWLRNFGLTGVLDRISGILFAKPLGNKDLEGYKETLVRVVAKEFGRPDLPILFNMSFGHTTPTCVLPYGAEAEIDCEKASFRILESGVV